MKTTLLIILRNGERYSLNSEGNDLNTDMRVFCDTIGARFPLDIQTVEVLPNTEAEEEHPTTDTIEPLEE